jgi:hypothetical protein
LRGGGRRPRDKPCGPQFHQKSRVSRSGVADAAFQVPSRLPLPAVADVPAAPSLRLGKCV